MCPRKISCENLHQLVSRLNSTSTASDISLAASFGMIPPGCPQRIDEFNSSIDCLVKKSHDCLDKAKMHGINAAQRMFYKQALLLVTMSALSIPSVLMAVMTNDFYDTLSLTVNSIWLCSVGMDVWYAWKDWSAKVKGEAELPMASDSLANLLHYFAHKHGYSDTSSQSIAVVGSSIFRFIRATATVLSGRLVPFDTPHNLRIWNEICNDIKVGIDFVLALAEASANIASFKSAKNQELAHINLLRVTNILKDEVSNLDATGSRQPLETVIELMNDYVDSVQRIIDELPKKTVSQHRMINIEQTNNSSQV